MTDRFAKIPAQINTNDKTMVKGLAVYLALKQFNWRGLILDYKKNIKEIALELNCSPNALRYKINYLLEQKLATKSGKNLQLISYKALWQKLEIISPRFLKIASKDIKELELFIYYTPIRKNIKSQQHEAAKKILVYEIEDLDTKIKLGLITPEQAGAIVKRASKRAIYTDCNGKKELTDYGKKLKKFAAYTLKKQEGTLAAHLKAYYKLMGHSFEMPAINPRTTLSAAKAAKLTTGSSAPSSGLYMLDKLYSAGLIELRTVDIAASPELSKAARARKYTGWHAPEVINSLIGKRRNLSNTINLTHP